MRKVKFAEKYAQLNPAQRAAVDAIEGPMMVIAGPGTGKTQVLAMRIGKILQETQMEPENILCLTFTESGVAAMRERLLELIGEAGYYVRINTFHSFCNEIIQEYPEIFALSPNWRALSSFEKIEILRGCLNNLKGTSRLKPNGDPYMLERDIEKDIKDLKQEDISPDLFQEIVVHMEKFVGAVQKDVVRVDKLKPKERTEVVMSEWLQKLRKEAQVAQLPEGMQGVLDNFKDRYEAMSAEAENEKELSKVRTAIKNEVKKWYSRMEQQLDKQRDLARVYADYQTELKRRGRYDFEDMIMMVIKELGQNDQLLSRYQEQYQYMLVDEFQDTNGAQNEIMSLWGSFDDNPNLFVVGDDKQSIFRFQGASLANMLAFYRKYPQAKIVSLENNYRSQPHVLSMAAAIIKQNEESLAKYIPEVKLDLIPKSKWGECKAEWTEYRTEETENEGVAQRIRHLIDEGVKPEEIAVLFRTNKDGRGILKRLQQLNVPVRLEAGEDALEDIAVQKFIQVLEYINNPVRDDWLGEILQYEWWGFDALVMIQAIREAYTNRQGLWEVIQTKTEFQDFVTKLANWKKRSQQTGLIQFWCEVLNESGWLKWVMQKQDGVVVMQKMNRIVEEARQWKESISEDNRGVNNFVRQLSLLREAGEQLKVRQAHMEEQAVRLMTAHKAKGLEFEHVFIIRLNNRHWGNVVEQNKVPLPHGLVRYDFVMAGGNNEDERRLFYVALTRAKQGLYLSRPIFNVSDNQISPSIFCTEWPAELVQGQNGGESEDQTKVRLLAELQPAKGWKKEEVKSWLKRIASEQVLSATHLNRYLACPQEFYQRFIIRIPEAPTSYLALGTAVHAALDFMVKEKNRDRGERITEASQVFQQVLQREIRESIEYERVLAVGQDMLRRYWEHYADEKVLPAASEWNMGRYNVRVEGVPITGKLDKIELLDPSDALADGSWRRGARVRIVDYKTSELSRGLSQAKHGGDYWRQLGFYKLLCESAPQFPYTAEEFVLDFIRPDGKKGNFVRKKVEITGEDMAELKETIKKVWNEIQDLGFMTGEKNSFCGQCRYCRLAGVEING